jgi:hypothetical protein
MQGKILLKNIRNYLYDLKQDEIIWKQRITLKLKNRINNYH